MEVIDQSLNENVYIKGDDILNFLKIREGRLYSIEIANTLHQTIGLDENKSKLNNGDPDNFFSGCISSFFGFIQIPLVESIFVGFIAIVGNYDYKNDILKSWHKIYFSDEEQKKEIMVCLKKIRATYVEVRNNCISHINPDYIIKNIISGVLTKQIAEDVAAIRKVCNTIRRNYGLPEIIRNFLPYEHYPVIGLNRLIQNLNDTANQRQDNFTGDCDNPLCG